MYVSSDQEDFYAWGTWKAVSLALETSALWATQTSSSSVEAKVRGCSDAGWEESNVWGMENDGEEVEKETSVWEEKEICDGVGGRGNAACAQEMENVFSLERRLCAACVETGYGCVASLLHRF